MQLLLLLLLLQYNVNSHGNVAPWGKQNRCEMLLLGMSFEPLSQFDDFWPCRIVAGTDGQ